MRINFIIKHTGSYSDPVLEALIDSENEKLIHSAKELGLKSAVQKVFTKTTNFNVITEPIKAGYNRLLSTAQRAIEGYLGISLGKLQITEIESEIEVKKFEKEKLETTLHLLKYKAGNILVPTVPKRQFLFGIIISAIILLTDTFLLGTAIQAIGSSLIISLILGVGITTCIATISIFGTRYAEKSTDTNKKRIILFGIMALIGTSVYVISELRNAFYKSQGQNDFSPIKLSVLSILTFVAFHFIYLYLLAPTLDKLKERREQKDKLKNIEKLEREIQKCNSEIKELEQKIIEIKNLRLAVLAYSKSIEELIIRYFYEALAQFKSAYIDYSGTVPECFNQENKTNLNTFYHDLTITPKLHENH